MRKSIGVLGMIALLCLSFIVNGNIAGAQRSGGGGGGGSRAGGTNLIFDYCPAINGRIPIGTGNITITTYVTTVNLNIKSSNVDLPDNTELTVTVFAKDWITGKPWAPKVAGTMSLLGRKGALQALNVYQTAAGLVPIVSSIVITDPNGNVVMSWNP